MRKLFGVTQYVKIGEDVEPNEEYLQLAVKNMWDFSSDGMKFYENGFIYHVTICKRTNNYGSYTAKRASKEDLTLEEIEAVNNYLKR